MNTRWTAAALVMLAVAVPLAAQSPSIVGEVTYRERIALPPTALLEVSLEDVSRAGSAGEVVSRLTQRTPSGSPIPFDLPFDAARIDPRNRYAVRAEIRDGRRVLFTSTEAVLAVTQGRGAKVAIPLRMVNAPLKPVADAVPVRPAPAAATTTPLPAVKALPPPVELRNLPATFTGTLAGMAYELNLFPNDSFFMRTTRVGEPYAAGTDDVGSWVLSSDRREVVLKSARGSIARFAIRDNLRLRKLDAPGDQASQELRRSPTFRALDVRGAFTGAYALDGSVGRFIECSTGQTWAVAPEGASEALATAYRTAGTRLGAPVILTVQGRLETRRTGAREAGTVFVAENLGSVERNGACETRFAALPLENTRWMWSPAAGTAPSLVFRGESGTFSGAGGCQQTTGRFRISGEALALQPTGTMRACRPGETADERLSQALGATRRYRIAGNVLELYGGEGQVVARFEGQ
jgi:putative lipoprotein